MTSCNELFSPSPGMVSGLLVNWPYCPYKTGLATSQLGSCHSAAMHIYSYEFFSGKRVHFNHDSQRKCTVRTCYHSFSSQIFVLLCTDYPPGTHMQAGPCWMWLCLEWLLSTSMQWFASPSCMSPSWPHTHQIHTSVTPSLSVLFPSSKMDSRIA